MEKRQLGTTGIRLSPVGLGCWQFSKQNGLVGGYWRSLNNETVTDIVGISMERGINWFDTAEVYGWGASEQSLVSSLEILKTDPASVFIADKWWPVLRSARTIPGSLEKQLNRMGSYSISLYQIHNPLSLSSLGTQVKYLADALEENKISAIGVSNFSAKRMDRTHRILNDRNISLASNQVRFHLLDRTIETNGVLELAQERNISIIAWSPLAQGLLTGKFHRDPLMIKKRPGPRRWRASFLKRGLEKTQPLINLLKTVGEKYEKTVAQVALNWVLHVHGKSVFAIPGASSVRQAEENAGGMSFNLTDEEMELISIFKVK